MKKILFTIFIFVLLFNCTVLCGKNNKGKKNQVKNDVRKKRMLEKKARAKAVIRNAKARTKAAMRDANAPEALARKVKMERRRGARRFKDRNKIREIKRREMLAAQRDPNRAGGKLSRGKGALKRGEAVEKQATKETAKHRKRLAKLKRIRELAVKQGDEKTIARVNKILQKELRRHRRKQMHLRQIGPRAGAPTPRGALDEGTRRRSMEKRVDKQKILELKKKKAKLQERE